RFDLAGFDAVAVDLHLRIDAVMEVIAVLLVTTAAVSTVEGRLAVRGLREAASLLRIAADIAEGHARAANHKLAAGSLCVRLQLEVVPGQWFAYGHRAIAFLKVLPADFLCTGPERGLRGA